MRTTLHRRRAAMVATAAAMAAFAIPATAQAAPTLSIAGDQVTIALEDAAERLVVGVDGGGFLTHSINGAAASNDFGGATIQAADANVTVTAAGGDDDVSFGNITVKKAIINGGAGNDLLFGSGVADELRGGDGDDRLVAARNPGAGPNDQMFGEAGNDTLVWNQGEGTDDMDGGPNADVIEVNGNPTGTDDFTAKPADQTAGSLKVRFDRLGNPGAFGLNIDNSERLLVNGLGGEDKFNFEPGLRGRILTTINGGVGADTINGTDADDIINGGDAVDTINGGAGDDRISGDRGNDIMNGGDGADHLVWNNGDGTDDTTGDAGYDTTEVNGAPGNEVYTIKPDAAKTRLDRTNVGNFGMNMDTEVVELNTFGGDDQLTVAEGTNIVVHADGGSGNDAFAGSAAHETFFGSGGNDVLTGGGGRDVLDGAEGDDTVNARDGVGDLVRCGSGNDTFDLDDVNTDQAIDCETGTRPNPPVAPVVTPVVEKIAGKLSVRSAKVSVKNRVISISTSCPAAATAGCKGTLDLYTAKKIKIAGTSAPVLLASKAYNVAAGKRSTIKLKLPVGYASLAPRGAKSLAAKAVLRNSGTGSGSKAISITLPKAK